MSNKYLEKIAETYDLSAQPVNMYIEKLASMGKIPTVFPTGMKKAVTSAKPVGGMDDIPTLMPSEEERMKAVKRLVQKRMAGTGKAMFTIG